MRRSLHAVAVATILLIGLSISGTGCHKKVTPPPAAPPAPAPPPPAPPPPAPTISFSANPSTIEKGQSTTLSWNSSNATSVTISGGVGTVESSGSRSVSPTDSTTYTARATGAGGNAEAEARVTVTVPPPVAPPPPPITDSMFFSQNVQDIFFDFDKYNIREDAAATLQNNARALAERSGIRFTIEGHCDERGSEKYNLALGDRRANSGKEWLVSHGVSADRVDTISYGKEKPFCSEHNEECWQKNRTDHFVIK